MATTMRRELAYDADVGDVAAMLNDTAFREEVLVAQHVLRSSVSIEGTRVTIERVWSADSLPSFARKFVGDEIAIVQDESWRTPTGADMSLAIPGRPGEMTGTATLTPTSAGGTVERIDLTISVNIPFVGGKIEKLIADMLDKALDREHRTGIAWLARA